MCECSRKNSERSLCSCMREVHGKMRLWFGPSIHYEPYAISPVLLALERGNRWEGRDGECSQRKRERERERRRKEKILNDETVGAVMLLARASTNGRTSSMATGSVTKRKAAISLYTPNLLHITPIPQLSTTYAPTLTHSLSFFLSLSNTHTHTQTQRDCICNLLINTGLFMDCL